PQGIIDHLKSYDLSKVHPMAALRTAISLLGLYDEEADVMESEANRRKAVRLQAQVATIVTAFSRIRKGLEPVTPKTDLTFAENFVYMLNDKEGEDIEIRSEEHTSELQSRFDLVCRLLLEKKK